MATVFSGTECTVTNAKNCKKYEDVIKKIKQNNANAEIKHRFLVEDCEPLYVFSNKTINAQKDNIKILINQILEEAKTEDKLPKKDVLKTEGPNNTGPLVRDASGKTVPTGQKVLRCQSNYDDMINNHSTMTVESFLENPDHFKNKIFRGTLNIRNEIDKKDCGDLPQKFKDYVQISDKDLQDYNG